MENSNVQFNCKKCGGAVYEVKEKSNGTGVATGLYCATCGQWHKWLNKQEKIVYGAGNSVQNDSVEELNAEIERLKKEHDEILARLETATGVLIKEIRDILGIKDEPITAQSIYENANRFALFEMQREIEGRGKNNVE